MSRRESVLFLFVVALVLAVALPASAQSFRVQCPTTTISHPNAITSVHGEPAYNGPTQYTTQPVSGTSGGYLVPTSASANGAVKCQQISGGDGQATMADGTQTYMFSFGPLSGLADIAIGLPGTEYPDVFNTVYPGTAGQMVLLRGDPATTDGATSGASPQAPGVPFTWNGAVGLTGDPDVLVPGSGTGAAAMAIIAGGLVTDVTVTAMGSGYIGAPTVTFSAAPAGGITALGTSSIDSAGHVIAVNITYTGFGYTSPPSVTFGTGENSCATNAPAQACLDGHVDPHQIIDVGVLNGNIPAPLMAFDEDDEFFLTLSNVGMIMRPDLFEQHTVHFHGYPNASSFYDGVPDASVAINIGGSFTYYYLAPDAGTYFWHCHITPPEHLQMGMVGQLHVRPRQDRVLQGTSLFTALGLQNGLTCTAGGTASTCTPLTSMTPDLRTVCNPAADILCSATMPAINTLATRPAPGSLCNNPTATGSNITPRYTYNDGDASTCYDVEYPIQMHGFDPNFHFVGMTFNPEMFVDMKDKYFLLNGRSYPDTVAAGPQATTVTDGNTHYSQPLPTLINIPVGGRALLRLVNLSVSEYHTLASLGIPMKEVGFNAKLLRDQAGNNTEFFTNSITLGGGESLDVILDASDTSCGSTGCAATLYPAGSVFYLYSPQLDHLSNDAENFGGMMTEVHVCNSVTSNTFGNTCN
jgi:hypothetical protein